MRWIFFSRLLKVSMPAIYYDLTFNILFYFTFGWEGLDRFCDVPLSKTEIRFRGMCVCICIYVHINTRRHFNSVDNSTGKLSMCFIVILFWKIKKKKKKWVAQKLKHSNIADNNYVMVTTTWSGKHHFLCIFLYLSMYYLNKRYFRTVLL